MEFVNSILYQLVTCNDHSTSLFRQLTVTNTVGCPSRCYDPTLEGECGMKPSDTTFCTILTSFILEEMASKRGTAGNPS